MSYAHDKHHRKARSKVKAVVFILVLMVIIGAGAILFGGKLWYQNSLRPLSDSLTEKTITVQPGATPTEIGTQLEKAGIIRSGKAFEWYVRYSGLNAKLQAGSYTFKPNESTEDIAKSIAGGKVSTSSFTIFPGKTLNDIQAAFVKAGFSQQDVSKALEADYYSSLPALTDKPALATLEGYIFPETFQVIDSTTPTQIIKQSLEELSSVLTPDLRASYAKEGLSLHEAITLASIVEKEVSNPDDRRSVAQVFLKRLKDDMPLGSDVTYHYAAELLGIEATPFIDSKYNTRKYGGLPPGPISNVSLSSLKAVANPAPGDYLYFVAGDDGKTYFSKTNAEHEALTALHCKKLCSVY